MDAIIYELVIQILSAITFCLISWASWATVKIFNMSSDIRTNTQANEKDDASRAKAFEEIKQMIAPLSADVRKIRDALLSKGIIQPDT